jgi:hypothetical protein
VHCLPHLCPDLCYFVSTFYKGISF